MRVRRILIGVLALLLLMAGYAGIEEAAMVRAGDQAPLFSGRLSTGETVSLAQFRGEKNVVLFFYPKDFTRGCTEQVCSFRDVYDELLALDAVVIGVSFDPEDSHRSFALRYSLPYPLLSDGDRSISRAYGTIWLGGLVPLAKRVSFVIDREGIVRYVGHHEFDITKHVEGVLEALRELSSEDQQGMVTRSGYTANWGRIRSAGSVQHRALPSDRAWRS